LRPQIVYGLNEKSAILAEKAAWVRVIRLPGSEGGATKTLNSRPITGEPESV
jgi:hypothetical protein